MIFNENLIGYNFFEKLTMNIFNIIINIINQIRESSYN